MAKAVLNDLVNLENQISVVNTINANNAVIETAFDNTLSRNGSDPNQMNASLDMNSNRILNLVDAVYDQEPVTLNQLRAVSVNPTGYAPSVSASPSVVIAQLTQFPSDRLYEVIAGYYAPGDAPLSTYYRVTSQPNTIGRFRSADRFLPNGTVSNANGGWWQLRAEEYDVRQVGVRTGSSTYAVANTTIIQALLNEQRPHVYPGADTYVQGTLRLSSGTGFRGITPRGFAWNSLSDGVLAQSPNQSRLIFIGSSYTTCFDSDPTALYCHTGGISDITIMVPDSAQYSWIFKVTGFLSWSFNNVIMANFSPVGAGGLNSAANALNPTWLNFMTNCSIIVSNTSNNFTYITDWSDSVLTNCQFTGGIGSLYQGPGNMRCMGCQFEKSNGAGFTVNKMLTNNTTISFMGCDFDANTGQGLIINGSTGTNTYAYFGVCVTGCSFRNPAPATSDIAFIDQPTTVIHGPIISNNTYISGIATPIVFNGARWTVAQSNNTQI